MVDSTHGRNASAPQGEFRKAKVVHTPGLADELMKELAPLLAADGIDLNNLDAYDIDTLNAALSRAVERRNFDLMVATGERLSFARTVLRIVTEALGTGYRQVAETLVWSIEPEPTDTAKASVGQVIGVSVGLADTWHSDAALVGMLGRTVVRNGQFRRNWACPRGALLPRTSSLWRVRVARSTRSGLFIGGTPASRYSRARCWSWRDR